ncbi:FISUMP domain-containing protein [Ekhidna sp. To15]|uniref:FISUMP domain-containing protein n=1 Tax=Ekhidna sp. To15 TaxID=3395267 RepID=UPI003F51FAED
MRIFVLCFFISSFTVAQQKLIDKRDGIEYDITKLGNLYWMMENLRYEASGSLCLEDCDQIRFYDFNYLKRTCPEGWRLPTMSEWDLFTQSFATAQTARMMEGNKKLYRVDFLDRYNIFENNVLNIQPYGRMEGGALGKGNFIDFWAVNPQTKDERFHMHLTPYSIVGHGHKHHLKTNDPEEFRLFPVRCVCETEKLETN